MNDTSDSTKEGFFAIAIFKFIGDVTLNSDVRLLRS